MFKENPFQAEDKRKTVEMAVELESFIKANKFTANQVRDAYYRLCGISEKKEGDDAVERIFAKLTEAANNGFPLNYLASLVSYRQWDEEQIANAIPKYHSFIDGLAISTKEKDILKKIVNEDWTGDLSVVVDGDVSDPYPIPHKKDISKELLAHEMGEFLKGIIARIPKGKPYGFMFVAESKQRTL